MQLLYDCVIVVLKHAKPKRRDFIRFSLMFCALCTIAMIILKLINCGDLPCTFVAAFGVQ